MTMPTIRPPRSSGAWWTWCSSMKTSVSNSVASGSMVRTGRVATSPTGVSGPRPSASTRLRRSRSVRMPGGSQSTSTELMRPSRMSRAASPTVSTGPTRRRRKGQPADRRAELSAKRDRLQRRRVAQPLAEVDEKELGEALLAHQPLKVAGDLVEQRVLGGHHVHVRAGPADERGKAEALAFLEHLHDVPVALEADGALPDHVEALAARPAALQHLRVPRDVADLQRAADAIERFGDQAVKGGMGPEEFERLHALR